MAVRSRRERNFFYRMFSNVFLRVSDAMLFAEFAGSGFCAAILLQC